MTRVRQLARLSVHLESMDIIPFTRALDSPREGAASTLEGSLARQKCITTTLFPS